MTDQTAIDTSSEDLKLDVEELDVSDVDFHMLGLCRPLLKALTKLDFKVPTPIQAAAIPLVLEGNDVMGLAQTGTGKTAAFGLPLVNHLIEDGGRPDYRTARSLILAPTRELANQIATNIKAYVRTTSLKVSVVVGGASINAQRKQLERGTDVLVATPGRLVDLVDRGAVSLHETRFLVLDEADQMLDLGFIHTLREISRMLAKPRQTMLFSATMSKQMDELAQAYLTDPIRVEAATPGKVADKVHQSVYYLQQGDKLELLKTLLAEEPDQYSIVFARTKHGCEKMMKKLVDAGFKADSVHGNKSQGQRDRALRSFRNGDVNVLVATDVAARGLDIPHVGRVFNYELPEVPENYVHRIGRTARAGAEGQAIAFCAPAEAKLLREIQKVMGITIEVAGGEAPQFSKGGKGKGGKQRQNPNNNRANSKKPHRGQDRSKPYKKKAPKDDSFEMSTGHKYDRDAFEDRAPDSGEGKKFEKRGGSKGGPKSASNFKPKHKGRKDDREFSRGGSDNRSEGKRDFKGGHKSERPEWKSDGRKSNNGGSKSYEHKGRDERRAEFDGEKRSEYRGKKHNDNRSEYRGDKRNDSRGENKGDSWGENRGKKFGGNRSDGRNEGRNDNRNDSRGENRSGKGGGKWEGRDNRSEGRGGKPTGKPAGKSFGKSSSNGSKNHGGGDKRQFKAGPNSRGKNVGNKGAGNKGGGFKGRSAA